jgi:hypothetical protein
MQYYGSSGLDLHGEIYHQTMETGRIHIEGSLVGKRRESGRSYWRSS